MMYHSSLAPHCLMENDIMNTSPEIADHNPMVIDGIPSHMFSGALVHPDSLAVDSRSQIMAGYPLVSTFQEHINNLQDDLQMTNHGVVIGDGASISRCILPSRQANGDVSVSRSHSISNSEFQGQFMGGASQSATPLASVTETSKTLHENFDSVTISATSAFPLEDLSAFVPNGCCNTSNSSLTASVNWEYNGGHGNMELIAPKKDSDMTGRLDGKWDFEKFLGSQELTVKILTTTMCEPYHVIGSSEPPGWISSNKSNSSTDNPYGYCMPGNELSLSLATCQPSIISVPSIPDQCSEKSCSGVTQHSLHEVGLGMGLGLKQTFCKSKELSLGFGSYRSVHFSHILSGSKYLHVAQQILTEIASYSLENLDNISYSPGGIGTGAKIFFSKDCSAEREVSVMDSAKSPFSVGKTRFESQIKLTLQRQEVEAKKAQLLALLQVADNRYSQCLDEIHAVISAFDAATELDPQIHTRFVLQTFSLLYSNLRERITKAIGELLSGGCLRQESSFGSSLIQKQLTLQQIRSEDHQSWRPQRGLPERSVSVLRAWMFQNFLHPYPKDEEKHLLAIRSGLTRNQVSNWFINARVRLWKPMIEEMYSEMSNKRVRRTEEGTNNDVWYHIKH